MDKRIHIIHIIDNISGIGGAERMLFELVTRFPKDRFDCEVIGLGGTKEDYYFRELVQNNIPVRIIPKKSKCGIRMFFELVQYFRKSRPDIVHTHLFASDVWGGYAAYRAQVPIIISTEHNINKNEGWVKHRLKCVIHHKIQAIVAISHAVEHYIVQYCSSVRSKILVIPNGIDVHRFSRPHTYQKKSVPVIAVVGRLEEQKGHIDLLHALSFVHQPLLLRIIGEGSLHRQIQQQAQQLSKTHEIRLEGTRTGTDLEKIYADADVVIVPSRWEGFGLVALEAMAAGCPVLVSDVDGLRECVEQGKTGLRVNMQQPQRVAEVLQQFLKDSSLRQQLGEAARIAVAKKYSIEYVVKKYIHLYESFL
ncbi:MAG TPA: glycosyltransferase family 4 protein [Patescibacteria group bacterium]|nr:glycosyltransferase family 4 protein [Patescibacteria group bacterium]